MNKLSNILPILAVSTGIVFTNSATAEETEISPIETFGWFVAKQSVGQMEFNEEELAIFKKGFEAGATDTADIGTRQDDLQKMQTYLQGRMTEIREREQAAQKEINAKFFEELAKNDAIVKAESGLYYEITEPGDDTRATDSDSVTLHYHGTLTNGTVFDSSKDRGEPATFSVSGVVPGFSEGVKLVGNGGKVKLYIPPELGYGEQVRPGGPIPPNATLIFEVEMIKIDKKEEAAAAE